MAETVGRKIALGAAAGSPSALSPQIQLEVAVLPPSLQMQILCDTRISEACFPQELLSLRSKGEPTCRIRLKLVEADLRELGAVGVPALCVGTYYRYEVCKWRD